MMENPGAAVIPDETDKAEIFQIRSKSVAYLADRIEGVLSLVSQSSNTIESFRLYKKDKISTIYNTVICFRSELEVVAFYRLWR